MIPWKVLGIAQIPNNGGQLKLSQRGEEFSISLGGLQGELMNSRAHGSEDALAVLGCTHIQPNRDAQVLVGGLGMGFTLAAALNCVSKNSTVTVAELIPDVVEWNKGPLGECAGKPLNDPRTQIHIGDVAGLFNSSKAHFNAILLDVDNGPEGITHIDNDWLYSDKGLIAIHKSLKPQGRLAIWSATPDPRFVKRLKKARFRVTTQTVRAHAGKGSRHTIFLAQKV